MKNFKDIKKMLSMSTTMPIGTGSSSAPWMMGSAHGHHHHKDDGSCCGHDHSHDHHHLEDDEECCDEDHTNPSGGCC